MTHPTPEEWMSFLYDELAPDTRSALQVHLEVCPECRAEVETWQRATRRLNDWPLPKRRKQRRAAPLAKWAAAAAIMALATFGGARLWALNSEVAQLRTDLREGIKREVETSVRLKLAQQMERDFDAMLAELREESSDAANAQIQHVLLAFAKTAEEKRLADQRTLLTALQQVQTKHGEDYARLRRELETVAVLTEAGLQRAQHDIAAIAAIPNSSNQ